MTDYDFDAVLLEPHGDRVIARQGFRTVGGAPLKEMPWSIIDANRDPLAVYDATLIDNPNPVEGDTTVYYRASNHRTLFGPTGTKR